MLRQATPQQIIPPDDVAPVGENPSQGSEVCPSHAGKGPAAPAFDGARWHVWTRPVTSCPLRKRPLKIQLDPCQLTAETIGTYRLFLTDKLPQYAARDAAAALSQLFTTLSAQDLLICAAAMPDGVAWLKELNQSAASMRAALLSKRGASDAMLKSDTVQLYQLDSAAITLYQRYSTEAQGHKARCAQEESTAQQMRSSLAAAGLSDAEIARTLAHRAAGENSRADDCRTAQIDAELRVAALESFLADPLRRLDVLGPALEAERLELHEALATRSADVEAAIKAFSRGAPTTSQPAAAS
jgi:hypothetical protein